MTVRPRLYAGLRERDAERLEALQKVVSKKDFEIVCLQRQLGSKPKPELHSYIEGFRVGASATHPELIDSSEASASGTPHHDPQQSHTGLLISRPGSPARGRALQASGLGRASDAPHAAHPHSTPQSVRPPPPPARPSAWSIANWFCTALLCGPRRAERGGGWGRWGRRTAS